MATLRDARRAALSASLVLACTAAPPEVVRVGDAVPRAHEAPTVLDVVEAALAADSVPRMQVVRWSSAESEFTVAETDQARRFADDPSVVAAVGHSGSKMTLLAAPIYHAARLPLVVPTATARALRGRPGIFMLAPSDDALGSFLADVAIDSLRGARIALMHIADVYGDGIAIGVADRMRARGAPAVATTVITGRECTEDPLATHVIVRAMLQRSRPDVVILALSQPDAVCAIREIVAAQPTVRILTSDSYTAAEHRGITDAERRAVYTVSFWEPGTDSLSQRFTAAFRAKTGRMPDAGQALSHDAFMLLRQAVREGQTTRAGIQRWLESLGTDAHPPVLGVTGPIHFRAPRSTVLRVRHLAAPDPG